MNPGICNDQADNNCNGLIDEGCINQRVAISLETVKVPPCGAFSLTVYYDCNDNTSGLGINIHFDSSKLTYTGYDNFLDKGDIKAAPALTDDLDNEDNDANTDKMITMSWASFSSQWSDEDIQAILAKLNFTADSALPMGQETLVNISYFENDIMCNFISSGAMISINPFNLDIDDNGEVKALTDGLLIMRYLLRYPQLYGDGWINRAVAPNCGRCSTQDIENYLSSTINK